ncbi:MAG TPA: CRTAC1 family protein [Vicinamibacterales bacterium]|nr:CRTAC1 family protein [Vicinamibacterales bacterium]
MRIALVALGLLVPLAVVGAGQRGADATSTAVTFRDIASAAGVVFRHVNGASPAKHFAETMGSGGLFFDYDGDGWIDIFLVDGGSQADPAIGRTARHRLFRNRRNGSFEDVTAKSGIRHGGYGMGACAGDYDNDGRIDLYITNASANALYRNAGGGSFTDVTAAAGVGSTRWASSCGFLDFDRDGDLDIFVTNYVTMGKNANRVCRGGTPAVRVYCHPLNFEGTQNTLYRNNGKGTFTDVVAQAGIATFRGNGLGVAVADYDDDGLVDVFVANDAVPNFLFHNDGKGRFTETALGAGVAVATDGQARAGMGTMFGDYDGDGRVDLVVTNHETEMHSLFRNLGGGLFADATVPSGVGPATVPYVGFGVVFFDYDNDSDLDLAEVNGHVIDNVAQVRNGGRYAQKRLLLQNTGGRFRDVSAQSGPAFAAESVGRTLASGDIDNDGDLDLLVTNNGGRAELLRNDGGNRANGLLIRLAGEKSNRDGIGARLRITLGTSGGTRTLVRDVASGGSYQGQNDLRVHVGLGDRTRAERIEIRWPSGLVEQITDVPANQIITVREGQGIVAAIPFAGR